MSSRLSLTPVLAFALLLGGCDKGAAPVPQATKTADAASGEPVIDPDQKGEAMPAATLTDPEGRTLATAALRGKPVLVNLWATWCGPCVREMPLLADLANDYAGRLEVVTIASGGDSQDKVAAFFAERGLAPLPHWSDEKMALLSLLGAASLPVTVLYDAQGKEVWRVVGDMDWAAEEQRAAIDAALAR